MKTKALTILMAMLFIATTVGAQTPPPVIGDWDISDTTTYDGQYIVLNGNWTVDGTLTLTNSTVLLNQSRDFEYEVFFEGIIEFDNVTITSNYTYNLILTEDSIGNITNSTILHSKTMYEDSGINVSSTEFSGSSHRGEFYYALTINNTIARMDNLTVTQNYGGIQVLNSTFYLNDSSISYNMLDGINSNSSDIEIVRCSVEHNAMSGMNLDNTTIFISEVQLMDNVVSIYQKGGVINMVRTTMRPSDGYEDTFSAVLTGIVNINDCSLNATRNGVKVRSGEVVAKNFNVTVPLGYDAWVTLDNSHLVLISKFNGMKKADATSIIDCGYGILVQTLYDPINFEGDVETRALASIPVTIGYQQTTGNFNTDSRGLVASRYYAGSSFTLDETRLDSRIELPTEPSVTQFSINNYKKTINDEYEFEARYGNQVLNSSIKATRDMIITFDFGDFIFDLEKGWNLMSFPIDFNLSTSDFIEALESKYYHVYNIVEYNEELGAYESIVVNGEPVNNTYIVGAKPYYISSEGDYRIPLGGDIVASDSRTVLKGWTLIPIVRSISTDEIFSKYGSRIDFVTARIDGVYQSLNINSQGIDLERGTSIYVHSSSQFIFKQ